MLTFFYENVACLTDKVQIPPCCHGATTLRNNIKVNVEYHVRGIKLYMCCVDLEKAFDRVPRRVLEWAMTKKGIPDVLVCDVSV